MKKESRFVSYLRRNGAALLLTAGLCVLYYIVAYRLTFGNNDYAPHARWAMLLPKKALLPTFYNGSYRLWHVLVRLAFDYVFKDLYKVSALVTALANASACYLVYRTFETTVSRKMPRWLLAVVMLTPFLVTALVVPGHGFYASNGAVTTWHNPTNIMVRPFAAAVFYMTVRIFNRRRYGEHALFAAAADSGADYAFSGGFWAQFREPVYTKAELVLYPLCILFSTYAKPSFLQFFAPAIFVFLVIELIRTKGMLLPFCIKLALSYIPAAIIVCMTFFNFFPSSVSASVETASASGAGIAVYYLQESFSGIGEVLGETWWYLMVLLLPCVFVLCIFLCGGKKRAFSSMNRLAVIGILIGFVEVMLLHETGDRAEHGNLLWGFYLAIWVAWTAAAGQYAELVTERTRRGRIALYVGTPLLAWHLVCGVIYVVRILQTADFFI